MIESPYMPPVNLLGIPDWYVGTVTAGYVLVFYLWQAWNYWRGK